MSEGGRLLQPEKIFPTLAFYYEKVDFLILLNESLVDPEIRAVFPAYHDLASQDLDVIKQLAVRL